MTTPTKTALLLGSSGLVGGHVLRLLAVDDRWSRIVTLGRRPAESLSATHIHHAVDFEHLDLAVEYFECDDVFCCLGTTIKQAGSKDAFRRVDLDYPVEAGYLAHAAGATQYLLLSSLGANPASRIFYNRTKGEVERALTDVGFDSLGIFRPSLLLGDRAEPRPGEVVGGAVLSIAKYVLRGPLRKYRATPAKSLAHVVVEVAAERPKGVNIYEADAIMARAQQMSSP